MPITIDTPYRSESSSKTPGEIAKGKERLKDLYKPLYTDGLNLTPGSKLHERLKDAVLMRARESEQEMKKRHPRWDTIDQQLRAYIPTSTYEEKLKNKDSRKPISIVVPESYATLETFLTYMLAAFGDSPTFKYSGMGPEDRLGAIMLEKIIDQQIQRGRSLLDLYSQWRDGFAYGIGIVGISWEVLTTTHLVQQDEYQANPVTGALEVVARNRVPEDRIMYEGSKISVVDPRRYLPDPTVNIYRVQEGEYVGWVDTDQYMNLLRQESEDGSAFFNIRYLEGDRTRTSIYREGDDQRHPDGDSSIKRNAPIQTNKVDLIYMYIDLIPKDWKLGDSDRPEKWLFVLANDSVIVAAHPMNLYHNMFPVAVCAPDFGGHELIPISKLEIMAGFQTFANFIMNSKIEAVRMFLKNRLIIDPKLVNQKDVTSGSPVIRTRPTNWGRGVQGAAEQLKMTDITGNHMADLSAVMQMSRSTTGAVDALQGLQRTSGERVSRGEFEATSGAARSRLQKSARIISMQSMQDIALIYAFHTQQFMSEETYVQASGRWEETLRKEYEVMERDIKVSPFDLNVMFDVVAHDGSVSGTGDAEGWIEWMRVVGTLPELQQTMDMTRIGIHIARLLGAKDAEEFRRKGDAPMQAQIAGDEAVAEQYGLGNLVPLGGQ